MKFVKDHHADAGQVGVGLDHARQDAFGHHFDAGGLAHFRLAAHAIAYRFAHRLAQCFGHTLGSGARGQSARLKHQDAPRETRLHQRQRHARGLARTGGRLQNQPFVRGKLCADRVQHVING